VRVPADAIPGPAQVLVEMESRTGKRSAPAVIPVVITD